ncbi:MAG TPA: Arc family DNA-binding protein [Anaerolineales bacterium]|nr:Arc family DNA-binding protein [Anaerolineales bacterium]
MADLLIRGIPDHIHLLLKTRADHNGRSMNMEALALLEEAFSGWRDLPDEPPTPFKGTFPIDNEWLRRAIEEGRS